MGTQDKIRKICERLSGEVLDKSEYRDVVLVLATDIGAEPDCAGIENMLMVCVEWLAELTGRVVEDVIGDIRDTLIKKNNDYGDTGVKTPVMAPDVSNEQGLRARMSDKVARIEQLTTADYTAQVAESLEDTVKDLAGYCVLYLAAEENDDVTKKQDVPSFTHEMSQIDTNEFPNSWGFIDTVFIDLDGVLVDFHGGFEQALIRRGLQSLIPADWPRGVWSLSEAYKISNETVWNIIDTTPSFWENLEPYPWMDAVVNMIPCDVEIKLLSSPSQNPSSWSGKAAWVKKQFGTTVGNLILTNDKTPMANSRSLLIDDSDKNVESFRNAGGRAILFPQLWNQLHEKADAPACFLKKVLEVVFHGR